MISFSEFVKSNTGQSIDLEPTEIDQSLEEDTLRNVSAAVLFTRILTLSKRIKRAKDTDEKIDLLASQNSHVAALVVAMTDKKSNTKS